MSDSIYHDGKRYYESGYLRLAHKTSIRRFERIKELQAENKRLRETGEALREDLLQRAAMNSMDGELVVEASYGRWSAFCAALDEAKSDD